MVLRRTSWLIATSLVALAAIAAVAAAPPNLAKTIEAQRRLTTERPNDAGVFNDLGNLLLLVPQPEEAEAAYRRALELDPARVSALFNLGLLLQQRGELRDALQLYQQAVKAEPRHAWAQYQIGAIYEVQGQESKAIDAYAHAFALDPQLAFPEVNPHIVENKLVTEAMLRAYKADFAAPQAPKVYDDPARIAALLEPPVPAAGKDQVANTQQQAVQDTNSPRRQPGAPGHAQSQAQVLSERDLDRANPAGQAVQQTQGTSRGAAGARPAPSRGLREWTRPDPSLEEVPEGVSTEEGGEQPAPVVTPPPGGVYYRPGVSSTGRLGLQITPERHRVSRG